MSTTTRGSSGRKNLENFVIGLGKIIAVLLSVCWHGFNRSMSKRSEGYFILLILVCLLFIAVYWNWSHLIFLNWAFAFVLELSKALILYLAIKWLMNCLLLKDELFGTAGMIL